MWVKRVRPKVRTRDILSEASNALSAKSGEYWEINSPQLTLLVLIWNIDGFSKYIPASNRGLDFFHSLGKLQLL